MAPTAQEVRSRIAGITGSLEGKGSVLVAFSGGVDSAVVAALAHRALGKRALAVTAASETLAARELAKAREVAREIGIAHRVVSFSELSDRRFAQNRSDRCYFCQRMRFVHLKRLADELGFRTVASGTNLSDLDGHRPGLKAMEEHGVYQPLLEHGVDKGGVRAIARALELSTWDKPSMACMASRIPYGLRVTWSRLGMIERAEDILYEKGFRAFRVRHHGDLARIEIAPEEFDRALNRSLMREIAERLQEIGYQYVTLDLEGYRSGRLDEAQGLSSKRPSR